MRGLPVRACLPACLLACKLDIKTTVHAGGPESAVRRRAAAVPAGMPPTSHRPVLHSLCTNLVAAAQLVDFVDKDKGVGGLHGTRGSRHNV